MYFCSVILKSDANMAFFNEKIVYSTLFFAKKSYSYMK
jgi:hypothetical protein